MANPVKSGARRPLSLQQISQKKRREVADEVLWELRLYVAGQSPRSVSAYANLKKLCEEYLAGRYRIEVVDLVQHPKLAAGDQIVAIPTLVRKLPPPLRKIVGDRSDKDRALVGLQLRPTNAAPQSS